MVVLLENLRREKSSLVFIVMRGTNPHFFFIEIFKVVIAGWWIG